MTGFWKVRRDVREPSLQIQREQGGRGAVVGRLILSDSFFNKVDKLHIEAGRQALGRT